MNTGCGLAYKRKLPPLKQPCERPAPRLGQKIFLRQPLVINMLSLSTSFRALDVDDPEAFVVYLQRLGVPGVELEYRLTDRFFAGMRATLRTSGLQVTSIHNYFPFPTRFETLRPGGDLFLLSSPDREARQRAVNWTARTIEAANDLEAGVVVLHCGKVEMDAEIRKLHTLHDDHHIVTPDAQTFIGPETGLSGQPVVQPRLFDAGSGKTRCYAGTGKPGPLPRTAGLG